MEGLKAARFSKTLLSYCSTTWRHNPEDFDLVIYFVCSMLLATSKYVIVRELLPV
jgi:hypothetical protein